jgi:restriction endonuclease Mrr
MSAVEVRIPPHNEMMWPVIVAVRRLGGTARLEEIDEEVIAAEGFSDEQLAVLHKDGPRTEIAYRLAWARSYLKKMGMLTNATRGTWKTTPLGQTVGVEEIEPLWRECLVEIREKRRRDQKRPRRQAPILMRPMMAVTRRRTGRKSSSMSCCRWTRPRSSTWPSAC